MRIVIAHGRYRSVAPSGENRVVDRESALLREAGHHVAGFERHSDDIDGWSLFRKAVLPASSIHSASARRDLRVLLQRERPDVVHVHNTFPLLSPSVLYACQDAGVPVVATLHNYRLICASGDFFRDGHPCHDCGTGGVWAALEHGCYRGSRMATLPVAAGTVVNREAWRSLVSAYVFVSASQQRLMTSLDLPGNRTFVEHNFVPPPPALPAVRRRGIAYLGRLDAAKGAPFLMRAWDLVADADAELVLAGGGPLESQVRSWASSRPSVRMVGHLSPDDARRTLASAVAVVIPSQWEETFGLVAVEAMASGVAPIVPARGSFPELVTDGVDGVLFDPDSPKDLARVLTDAHRQPEHYLRLGRRAGATYAERFGSKRHLERLLDIYRFAVRNPVGRAVHGDRRAGPTRSLLGVDRHG